MTEPPTGDSWVDLTDARIQTLWEPAFRVAHSILGVSVDADEVADQSVFFWMRCHATGRPPAKEAERSWITTVSRRRASRLRRSASWRDTTEAPSGELDHLPVDRARDWIPTLLGDLNEFLELFGPELQLALSCRELAVLEHASTGSKVKEIGRALGIEPKAVRRNLLSGGRKAREIRGDTPPPCHL